MALMCLLCEQKRSALNHLQLDAQAPKRGFYEELDTLAEDIVAWNLVVVKEIRFIIQFKSNEFECSGWYRTSVIGHSNSLDQEWFKVHILRTVLLYWLNNANVQSSSPSSGHHQQVLIIDGFVTDTKAIRHYP
ncbi:hypothetical protein Pelo_19338 [Pelomyxa schiedti]|nr:hypothetical protein Pelo_19338 [Pelomyxa schiedti]